MYAASDSRNEDTPNNPSLMELQREPVIHFSITIFQENFSNQAISRNNQTSTRDYNVINEQDTSQQLLTSAILALKPKEFKPKRCEVSLEQTEKDSVNEKIRPTGHYIVSRFCFKVVVTLSTTIKHDNKECETRYKQMSPFPDDWPPPLKEKFTKLARKKQIRLIQAKHQPSIQYDYATGNVDNIVERKKAITLEQIFEPLSGDSEIAAPNRYIFVMDGAPGVGKTTLSRKICIDWAQGKLIKDHHVVIFKPLRELRGDTAASQEPLKQLELINESYTEVDAIRLAGSTKVSVAGAKIHSISEAKAVNESSNSEQVLNEAMKAGFVHVNTTNILFFGMAGTGKTSTKHLLLGVPPYQDRNSTPLASTAERIRINRKIRDTTTLKMVAQEDPSRTWKPVTSDDLQRIVADAIKYYVSSSDPNSELSAIPQELSIALKQLEAINESDMEVDTIRSAGAGAKMTQERERSKSLNTVSNVMANIKRFSDYDHTAVQEKFGSHWIYMIDSGGQPHFHNLLPLFMPKISVALYILRLSDCLDDHPLVEYYKDSKPVGECFKSHLSVLDNFKYLVQSIQSHSENCKLICIGTHKDHQSECKETLSEKNKTLLNFVEKNFTAFFNLGKKDVIFPMDCKHCDPDSNDVAQTIRAYIHKLSQNLNINNEVLVPFWWFVLEIVVEKVSNDENRQVLSKTECVEIAKALHNFHEDALCEALKFFHEHHIFHYYPAILPNVVFCDTQVLLDKVTEVVEFAAYSRGSTTSIHGLGNWLNFTDKGIITIELLSDKNFEKHYVDGLFAPTHLIEIFKHLLIATPFGIFSRRQDKRFYMPSLLSLLPPTQVNDKRAELLKTGLIPLVLHFKNNWQCCGVFCCLQVYLIKECEWEIEMEDHQLSRNFVQFVHREEDCFITLIDGFSFLEIHSSNNQKEMLSLIYENVHSGLRSAYRALKYTYEDPKVSFLCPHDFLEFQPLSTETSPQVPHHPACVMSEDNVMRCTLCKEMTYRLEDGHKDWVSACELKGETMLTCTVNILYHMYLGLS